MSLRQQLFAVKSMAAPRRGDGQREPPAARARAGHAHRARRRRHHRRRHLRADRPGGARLRRSGPDAVVRHRRPRLRLRRAVLRRIRLDDSGGRQRLHVRLRHAGRAAGLDHRLGPDPRVRHGVEHRRLRLVEVLPALHRAVRHCTSRPFLASRPVQHAGRVVQPAGGGRRAAGHRDPGDRHSRERQLQRRDGGRSSSRSCCSSSPPASRTSTPRTGRRSCRSVSPGVASGAAYVFFAYIGFDSVSTHAEEARNPQRDVPIGIIASLLLCTILYIAVAAVLTGMVPYPEIDINAPLAAAFARYGLSIAVFIISLGAVAGITSVLLVLMLSQPRVFFAMARDGLLPYCFFGTVHPRFRTPSQGDHPHRLAWSRWSPRSSRSTPWPRWSTSARCSRSSSSASRCGSCATPTRNQRRPFRCPFVPAGAAARHPVQPRPDVLARAGTTGCGSVVWLAVGLVIYFAYSRHHSRSGASPRTARPSAGRRLRITNR